jgi:hypothetical protein
MRLHSPCGANSHTFIENKGARGFVSTKRPPRFGWQTIVKRDQRHKKLERSRYVPVAKFRLQMRALPGILQHMLHLREV